MEKEQLLGFVEKNQLEKLVSALGTTLQSRSRLDLKDQLLQLKNQHSQYVQNLTEKSKNSTDLDIEAEQLRKEFTLFIQDLFEESAKSENELLRLVGKNQLKKLLAELDTTLRTESRLDLENQLTQLKGQYSQYMQNLTERTKNSAELDVEAAQLRKSITLFIRILFEEPPKPVKQNRPSRWILLSSILVFCIGIISIGYLKWPTINFVLEGTTPYLAFRIDQYLPFNQYIYLDEFSSYTVQSLEVDTFQLKVPKDEKLEEIIFSGGQIKLEKIELPPNTIVNFELVGNKIYSQFFVDSLQCFFALRNTNLTVLNKGLDLLTGPDSNLVIAEVVLAQAPELDFIPAEDSMFIFHLLPISGLEFQRTSLNDNQSMKSEIINGTVTVNGVVYDNLKYKPYFDIIKPKSTTLSFHKEGDHFKIRAEGKAKNFTIGSRSDSQKSIKPTIIEQIAKSPNVNLIWSWVLGIIGLLGGIIGLWPKKNH